MYEIQLVQQLHGWWLSHCADIPHPSGVRAEVTSDNTSVRVSWQWSRTGLPMCVDLVRVHSQPEGGSLMMYTAGNTTATTSAILSNLQCNTEYTIWVVASSGRTGKASVRRMLSIPSRGRTDMFVHYHVIMHVVLSDFLSCK